MHRLTKYSLLLSFLSTYCYGQVTKLTANTWLSVITENTILKPATGESFPDVLPGYALYFSKVDSLEVPYIVYVPKNYRSSEPYSLIVYLHGGVMSIDRFQYKNFSFVTNEPVFATAEKYNNIVVYPFGRKDFGWVKQPAAFQNILTILSQVEQIYNIDKQRIFLGGMSNGGSAAFWFITHQPEKFKAFFAFSALPKLYQNDIAFRNLTERKPLYSFSAKNDEVFSFEKVKLIYEQHKTEAPGWHFDSVNAGNHGFIYNDSGAVIMDILVAKLNNTNASPQVYDSITKVLLHISEEDQKYRNQMEQVREKYGGSSKEIRSLFKITIATDSLNLIIVKMIIDKFGWVGADKIGTQANTTLFGVIQHSDLKTQKKYLPMMTQAVKDGNAEAASLALLEDRIAIAEGKRQLYGSQLLWNLETNTYIIRPLADPDNIDKRRAEVGLGLYSDYLKIHFNIIWDAEQYKKDLLKIEAQLKAGKSKPATN